MGVIAEQHMQYAMTALVTIWSVTTTFALAQSRPTSQPVAAPGASLQLLADGFTFTEGPACDATGNVYFTDQPSDRILKWDAGTGKISTFLQPCGRSNGLCFDVAGNLIAGADEKTQMRSFDPDGKLTV